ncbi:MAG: valine--tRNA ligase [Oligoflexia bacterium]|nr:valine--tRNA ligase [Oligoflexia bacterium]
MVDLKYTPSEFESGIYKKWEEKGYFRSEDKSEKPPFAIVLPPPNVTGALHMGHALTCTIQDIIVRTKRMQGFNTVWFPGTDHAGIATQMVVERELAKKGVSRHDLGREKFLEKVWETADRHHDIIIDQMKTLGVSLDWERERFSLDEKFNEAVNRVFCSLHDKGLLYRGKKLISWCTRCGTALSDLEVSQEPEDGKLYYIKYSAEGSASDHVVVATTRPETLLGDTAVAVNPADKRFRRLKEKNVIIPFVERKVPVIADDYVDMEFGTGCLKITPGHDFNDYEIGNRHGLETVTVINKDGVMNENAGIFGGLKVSDARTLIIEKLKDSGALEKIEDYQLTISKCSRCGTVIEPLTSRQWFVKMDGMAAKATEAVKKGDIEFYPRGWWEQTYYNWLENIRDWCVSRQLWWGHRLPVWYCDSCDGYKISSVKPSAKCKCGKGEYFQDSDVMDTWFSAALWPFAAFGWPEKTDALKTFYPNQLMETGFDIIFFWVARMIMFGIEFMGDVPFRHVLYHAMVRDEKGQKMSKTRGNVIDPLETIKEKGADSLRFTLASHAGHARDIKLSESEITGYGNFMNKIWQASRFTFMSLDGLDTGFDLKDAVHCINKWIVSRLNSVAAEVEAKFQQYQLSDITEILYRFFWHEFCDWYIEFSKPMLASEEYGQETKYTLAYIHREILKLLHPVIPFITEELYGLNPLKDNESIMTASYPVPDKEAVDKTLEGDISLVRDMISSIRNIKSMYGITSKVDVIAISEKHGAMLEMLSGQIVKLAGLKKLDIRDASKSGAVERKGNIRSVLPDLELVIPARDIIDIEKEKTRLGKKLESVNRDLDMLAGKLKNPNFLEKARPEIIENDRNKHDELAKLRRELGDALEMLESCAVS